MLGYQYLLLLVFAISLATMQTAFAQQSPEDCGPDQIYQNGQCLDIDVMSGVNVDLAIYPAPFDNTANDMVTLSFTAKSDELKGSGAIDHLDYKVIISKDGNVVWSEQFHDHDGNLELQITPSEGYFTVTGGQEVGTTETKAFMVKGPIFMDNGNYQVTAQIVGIEFNPLPTPLTDDFTMQVVPEFGPIVMVILAAAIVGTIIVTTKSRVIPKL